MSAYNRYSFTKEVYPDYAVLLKTSYDKSFLISFFDI